MRSVFVLFVLFPGKRDRFLVQHIKSRALKNQFGPIFFLLSADAVKLFHRQSAERFPIAPIEMIVPARGGGGCGSGYLKHDYALGTTVHNWVYLKNIYERNSAGGSL